MISPTFSVRMIWPFTRILNNYSFEFEVFREAGFDESILTDPDARLPHAIAWKLMKVSMERTGNPALGLHAGETVQDSDWGILAQAALNCPDLRRAMLYCIKYVALIDDLIDIALVEQRDIAVLQIRYKLVKPLPALNDFLLSSSISSIARYLGPDYRPPIVVDVVHSQPAYASEYEHRFGAPVRFNAEHNAVVFAPSLLDIPLAHANPDLFSLFDREARRQFDEHVRSLSARAQVQLYLTKYLGRREMGINEVAKQVHMSTATLKRRLSDEKTTYTQIIDDVRREFALRYLEDRRLSIAEVSHRLGFSSTSAFGKAFKRWLGVTPVAYRKRINSSKL